MHHHDGEDGHEGGASHGDNSQQSARYLVDFDHSFNVNVLFPTQPTIAPLPAVIIVENALRLLAQRQHRESRTLALRERLKEVVASSREMLRPTIYGQLIIFLVFLPCLAFTGVEGKMFSPMVITLMLALGSAFVLSLTFVPALIAVTMNRPVSEKEVKIIRTTKSRYEPVLRRAVARPLPFIGAGVAVLVLVLASFAFKSVDREFMQGLNEISRDNGKRRIYVQANVVGRDPGGYVDEAQACLAAEVKSPTGS